VARAATADSLGRPAGWVRAAVLTNSMLGTDPSIGRGLITVRAEGPGRDARPALPAGPRPRQAV